VVAVGVGIGVITSAIFHIFLKEPKPLNTTIQNNPIALLGKPIEVVSHKSMLKSLKFYQVSFPIVMQYCAIVYFGLIFQIGLVYMCTRLFVNLTQVFTPLYLHKTLSLPGVTLASVPLAMFVSSFLTSLCVRPLNKMLGRKVSFSVYCEYAFFHFDIFTGGVYIGSFDVNLGLLVDVFWKRICIFDVRSIFSGNCIR
jgi:hypothetical protein